MTDKPGNDDQAPKPAMQQMVDEALPTRQLAAVEGETFVARRLLQHFPERILVEGMVDHTLIFHLGGEVEVERYYEDKLDHRISSLRSTTIAPAGVPSGWRAPAEVDSLHFYLSDEVLRRFAEEDLDIDGNRVEIVDRMEADDDFMKALVPAVLTEMQSDQPKTGLLLDSFGSIVASHLLRAYSTVGDRVLPTLESDLRRSEEKALRTARAFLLERIDENLGLHEVARHVGMSPFHFARVFKSSLGVTPHQFLMEQRLGRARHLLENSKDRIAEIAYACGFSSQAHMTSTFTKHLGITPAKYRKVRQD